MNKEGKGENVHYECLKVSSCVYLKNTIFHNIHNLGLSVLLLSRMKNISDSLPLMHFKIWETLIH